MSCCSHLDGEGIIQGLRLERPLECSQCGDRKSVWLCVSCGSLNCGRYAQAHGLSHFRSEGSVGSVGSVGSHAVVMESSELSLFCYLCDDYIYYEDESLEKLRDSLRHARNPSTGMETQKDVCKRTQEEEEEEGGGGGEEEATRLLRPRRSLKRSPSASGLVVMTEENSASLPQPWSKRLKKETPHELQLSKDDKEQKKDPHSPPESPKKSLVGLRNLGNTCFMSAVLQSLSNIQEFCRVLKQLPSFEPKIPTAQRELRSKNGASTEGPIMTEELKKVLVALSAGQATKKAISPEALFMVIWKVVPRFRGYQQQDAHEFLRYMLDRLHTELRALLSSDHLSYLQRKHNPYSVRTSRAASRGTSSSHSLVTAIFGGMLQSEVNCLVCNASSKKHDPFLDLSIDIPNKFTNAQSRKAKNNNTQQQNPTKPLGACHIQDCLQKFVDVEELADSERFFCGSCKNKQRSTKKFWIRRLPNVLCLHIKRFRWSPYSRTKLDTHVAFPLSGLDMSDYLLSNLHETRCSNSGSSLYDLAAVIVHHGSGAGSGHYTAFVTKNNNWYHFNDSTVLASNSETVLKSKAYILFYIQREFRQPGFSSSKS